MNKKRRERRTRGKLIRELPASANPVAFSLTAREALRDSQNEPSKPRLHPQTPKRKRRGEKRKGTRRNEGEGEMIGNDRTIGASAVARALRDTLRGTSERRLQREAALLHSLLKRIRRKEKEV